MTGPQRGDLVHGPPQPAVSLREATPSLNKSSLIQSVEGRAGGLGFGNLGSRVFGVQGAMLAAVYTDAAGHSRTM